MRRRYDLEPLRAVRQARAERSRADALEGARRVREAQQAVDAALSARARLEERAGEVTRAEEERLDRGEATVADLLRAEAFDAGLNAERAGHQETRDRAERALIEAQQVELEARGRAERARNEVDAVERHRMQWTRAQRREAEAREQDNTEDAWRARHRKP